MDEDHSQPPSSGKADADGAPIPVLHIDDALVVIAKPPGVMVHRSRESADRTFLLQTLRDQVGRYLYPVHRLDRAASGVMAFAFSPEDARDLQEALGSPEARKEYLVLVRGSTPETWESQRPLGNEAKVPQEAHTTFEKLRELSRCSLLRARIFTGRRHQIRRHLAHAAHQVIGDSSHGKGRINAFFRETYALPRLFLHAWRLEFAHPRSGEAMQISAPLADDLREFLLRLPDAPPEWVATL